MILLCFVWKFGGEKYIEKKKKTFTSNFLENRKLIFMMNIFLILTYIEFEKKSYKPSRNPKNLLSIQF